MNRMLILMMVLVALVFVQESKAQKTVREVDFMNIDLDTPQDLLCANASSQECFEPIMRIRNENLNGKGDVQFSFGWFNDKPKTGVFYADLDSDGKEEALLSGNLAMVDGSSAEIYAFKMRENKPYLWKNLGDFQTEFEESGEMVSETEGGAVGFSDPKFVGKTLYFTSWFAPAGETENLAGYFGLRAGFRWNGSKFIKVSKAKVVKNSR